MFPESYFSSSKNVVTKGKELIENTMGKSKVSPKSEKNLDCIGRLETQFSDDIPQKKIRRNWMECNISHTWEKNPRWTRYYTRLANQQWGVKPQNCFKDAFFFSTHAKTEIPQRVACSDYKFSLDIKGP